MDGWQWIVLDVVTIYGTSKIRLDLVDLLNLFNIIVISYSMHASGTVRFV